MKVKMFLLAIGVAGLLVVFALLAFTFAPRIVPTAAPAVVVNQPAQMDNSTTTGDATLINNSTDADSVQVAPQHIGRSCNADSAANTGY